MRGVNIGLGASIAALLMLFGSGAEAQSYSAHISGAWLGGGPCHYDSRSNGLAVGLGAKFAGGGGVFLGGGADLLVAPIGSVECLSYQPLAEFEGETVAIRGSTDHDPSFRARIESGLTVRRLHTELVAGVGMIGLRTSYPDGTWYSRELTLQPWFGAAATLLSPDAPFGLRMEVGRHRVPFRYYREAGGPSVDRSLWHTMYLIGLTISLGGGRSAS